MEVITYFGRDMVERTVADYFARYGVSEDVRDDLAYMAITAPDRFLELVCDYIDEHRKPVKCNMSKEAARLFLNDTF